MWNGVCPVCGSTEVYFKAGRIDSDGGNVGVGRGGWGGPLPLDAFICGQCGNVALRVPERDLELLHTIFEKRNWTRLKGSNEPK